ncbi:MAG: hypothetical protein KAH10_08770 [Flavobacteriales bacterium]|nr:hypothetical protein [Flavobacteriales bacterium]
MKKILVFSAIITLFSLASVSAQDKKFRNHQLYQVTTPYKMSAIVKSSITYEDLDKDGDPDVLKATLEDAKKIAWIDDDDDMKIGDIEGDMDNDCLMIDIDGDGEYGGANDLIVDYIDEDADGLADFQLIAENGAADHTGKWTSHYVWFIDNDKDGIMAYIDWSRYKFESWDHNGQSNFFCDYNGKSSFLKVHITSWNIENPQNNWENPFLYFDDDNDGLSEVVIRLVDEPIAINVDNDDPEKWRFSNKITLAQMSFDMDNDNSPRNELDFDMSLGFMGKGFDYADQVNKFKSNPVAKGSDKYFKDKKLRNIDALVYPNHDTAYDLIFSRGDWDECWFVFDEDDDCHRWERVEFYQPKDPFIIGYKKGGLDNNPQADGVGDRGEWDRDFSGEGNLYISPLDGKLHLYGAELGYWRIDQNTLSYQGWGGWRGPNIQPETTDSFEPEIFATIKYEDTDKNGFFDKVSYDMNGDHKYESVILLSDLGISDKSEVYKTADLVYSDYNSLHSKVADIQNEKGMAFTELAVESGLNTSWYSFLKSAKDTREKYSNGYWLSYYLYTDLLNLYKDDSKKTKEIQKKYFNLD